MKRIKGMLLALVGIITLALASCGGNEDSKVYKLNKESIEMNVNDTFTLELSVDGIVIMDDISWSSKDSSIASVKNGEVKALKSGSTSISCEYKERVLECAVKVLEKDNFSLSHTDVLLEVGNTLELKLNNNGKPVTGDIKWKSNDTDIVTIDNGTITGVASGEATITAIYLNKSYICNVVIMEKFNAEGSYVAERVVEEMGGIKFTFDLKLNSDRSYEYSRRTVEFEGDTFEGGVVNSGTWAYSNGLLTLTHSNGRIEFTVKNENTLASVGEIETGRVDSELTFIRK